MTKYGPCIICGKQQAGRFTAGPQSGNWSIAVCATHSPFATGDPNVWLMEQYYAAGSKLKILYRGLVAERYTRRS